jgi:V/A-type H+-transporting ATPase subunit E
VPADAGAQLIVKDILDEASGKASSIVKAAKKEAQTILDATKFDNKEEETSELKKAQDQGKQILEEITAEGRTRARRELLKKREELIDGIIRDAQKKLENYAASEKYEKELVKTVVSACKKLGSNQVIVQANRRDLKILEKSKGQIVKELGGSEKDANVSFGETIQTTGGARVAAQDGRVEIDETFEGKLRREMESLRVKIAKVLFEGSK